jgi:hypothetical protein
MKPPELLATLSKEALHADTRAAAACLAALRADGVLGQFEALTWVWNDADGAKLYRGAVAPPRRGDVVQCSPEHEWRGCLLVVDDVRNWGIIGLHLAPSREAAAIRINWADFEPTGGHVAPLPEASV